MMERRQWMLLIALLVLAGFALYSAGPRWLAWIAAKKSPPPTVAAVALPQPAQPPAQKETVATTSQAKMTVEDSQWGRNPFLTEAETIKPVVSGEAVVPTVRAIIMGRPKPVATIDGRVVTVGEKVGDEKVVEIREDSVVLEIGGDRRTLKIAESSVAIGVKEGKKR